MPKPFLWECRIYYEDTDAGGVVYYANYLKFAERARTEMLRAAGIDQSALAENPGLYFVVKRAALELHAPARLDDVLALTTEIQTLKGARLTMIQEMRVQERHIATLHVEIACVDKAFRPTRLPENIRTLLTC